MQFSVSYSILCLLNLMRKNILLGIRWIIYNIHRKIVLAFLSTLYFVMQASAIWHTGTIFRFASPKMILRMVTAGRKLIFHTGQDEEGNGYVFWGKHFLAGWHMLEDFTSLWSQWVRNDQSFTHVNNTPVPQNRLAMTKSS